MTHNAKAKSQDTAPKASQNLATDLCDSPIYCYLPMDMYAYMYVYRQDTCTRICISLASESQVPSSSVCTGFICCICTQQESQGYLSHVLFHVFNVSFCVAGRHQCRAAMKQDGLCGAGRMTSIALVSQSCTPSANAFIGRRGRDGCPATYALAYVWCPCACVSILTSVFFEGSLELLYSLRQTHNSETVSREQNHARHVI